MVEKKIDLTCFRCGCLFQIAKREHGRQVRNGRNPDRFFCSESCSCKQLHNEGRYDYEKAASNLIHQGRKKDEFSPFRWFVLRAKYRARKIARKECTLTVEYLKTLFEQQGGKCPFTNWDLNLPDSSQSGWKHNQHPCNASLDRIDNSKGYIEGNVRFVCLIANMARQTFSDEQVIEFCKAVSSRKEIS